VADGEAREDASPKYQLLQCPLRSQSDQIASVRHDDVMGQQQSYGLNETHDFVFGRAFLVPGGKGGNSAWARSIAKVIDRA
jgi:hypothetical protein